MNNKIAQAIADVKEAEQDLRWHKDRLLRLKEKKADVLQNKVKMYDMLRSIEWAGPDGTCPYCNRVEKWGHRAENCDLAKAIEESIEENR